MSIFVLLRLVVYVPCVVPFRGTPTPVFPSQFSFGASLPDTDIYEMLVVGFTGMQGGGK